MDTPSQEVKELNRRIEVMRAYAYGKGIEVWGADITNENKGIWLECQSPLWNWHDTNYRIKPSPQKRLIRAHEFPPIFWVGLFPKPAMSVAGLEEGWRLVTRISEEKIEIGNNGRWFPIQSWADCYVWSRDRIELRSFWIEE